MYDDAYISKSTFLLFCSKLRATTVASKSCPMKVKHISGQKQTEAIPLTFSSKCQHFIHIKLSIPPVWADTVFVTAGDKKVLQTVKIDMEIGTQQNVYCTLNNETTVIRWYNSTGQELHSKSAGGMKTSRDGTLTIESVKLSDGGIYTCKGLNYMQYYTFYVNGKSKCCQMKDC